MTTKAILFAHKRMKKQSLTLLEVVICMALMGMLLTGLFNCYRQSIKSQISAKQLKTTVQEFQLFYHRLDQLFSTLQPLERSVISQPHPQSVSEALIIQHEQKYDKEKGYCGSLQSMLYLDHQKRLCCATWNQIKEVRLEVLLENIESVHYLFFDKSEGKWLTEWSKNKKMTPSMIKIFLKKNGLELPFIYFLDHPSNPIEMNTKTSNPVTTS